MRMSTARVRLTGETSHSAALRPTTGHVPASSLVLIYAFVTPSPGMNNTENSVCGSSLDTAYSSDFPGHLNSSWHLCSGLCHNPINRLPRSMTVSTASVLSSTMSSAKPLRYRRVRAPEYGAKRTPVPTPIQNPVTSAVAPTMRERAFPFIIMVSPFILLQVAE
jgi:hypothetical protein